jgi:hypothetical protein
MSVEEKTLEKQRLCRAISESFFQEKPRIKFGFNDIVSQRTSFYERLEIETDSIYNSPYARKGRTKYAIRDSSFRGLVAEAWYIENQPFPGSVLWTERRWHDIIVNESKLPIFEGTHIEVKTISKWNYSNILNKIDSIVWSKWNSSSFVSMFLTNWDDERDKWFKTIKSKGKKGTFVSEVERGKVDVWWEYFGTKCIDPDVKIPV